MADSITGPPRSRRDPYRRHAAHYIGLAAEADRQYLAGGDGVRAGLAQFDQERAQLDAARAWLQNQPADPDRDALLLADANATGSMGELRYQPQNERIPQLQRALEVARRQNHRAAQAGLLGQLGRTYTVLGQTLQAIDYHEQCLAITRELGERRGEGLALGSLGLAYVDFGRSDQALHLFEQHLAIAQETGDRRGEGSALGNLGLAYWRLGETHRAADLQRQHLAIARETGDRQVEAVVLGNLGEMCWSLGDRDLALDCFEQRLTITRELGDRRSEGNALGSLGNAYYEQGDTRRAIGFYEQVLAITHETGDRRYEGLTLSNLGTARLRLGQIHQAVDLFEQRLAIAREIGDRYGEHSALGNLGLALIELGSTHQAVAYFEQQLRLARMSRDRHGEGNALCNLGLAYTDTGEISQARTCYEQALVIRQAIDDRQGVADVQWNLGHLLVQIIDTAAGLPLLEQSLAFHSATRHPRAVSLAATVEHLRMYNRLPEPAKTQYDSSSASHNLHTARPTSAQKQGKYVKALQPRTHPLPAPAVDDQRQEVDAENDALVRDFLPQLGDIALAAHGDPVARALAEARLPWFEEHGWRLTEAAQQIWAGERDATTLSVGLDAQERAVVRRTLALISDGPSMIFVAESLQIADNRRRADMIFAQMPQASPERRAALAQQFTTAAEQCAQQPGAPWAELAAHLRALARELGADGQTG